MIAYYNEIDPFCAAWLRNLIAAGMIPAGDVDTRDIQDVTPDEIHGYTQCHFFAGVGGWPLAMRMAGWPDDDPVWTGSCPCQPFSAAGKGAGFADERHLWPAWQWLIGQRRPDVIFGEQVASRDGLGWLDLVCADLEGESYTCRAIDLCAAGVGAPHIRQRLFWVADANGNGRQSGQLTAEAMGYGRPAVADGGAGIMADAAEPGWSEWPGWDGRENEGQAQKPERLCDAGIVGHAFGTGLEVEHRQRGDDGQKLQAAQRAGPAAGILDGQINVGWPGARHGGWEDADWLRCTDGRWRPVEPGSFPLAHGVPARVGRLRAYGNAIVPQVAAEFIRAYRSVRRADRGAYGLADQLMDDLLS